MKGIKFILKQNTSVLINKKKNILLFKGPLGILSLKHPSNLYVHKNIASTLFISFYTWTLQSKALIGTIVSSIRQKLLGVNKGFFIILKISGVGWQVDLKKSCLIFKVGYSHTISCDIPNSIEVFLITKQKLKIFGLDILQLTQFSSKICNFKRINAYKKKGITLLLHVFKLKTSVKIK